MKILIAEDDTLILRTLELYLTNMGYDVIGSVDGLDALEKIELHNPDLIITDVMLPYFSGLEIVGKIKQGNNAIPVIVVSAMGQQSVVDEAFQLGADDYISKPFSIDQLSSRIERFAKAV